MAAAAKKSSGSNTDLPRSLAGKHNPWFVAIIVSIATFMEVLDTSIANVALDHIRGDLGAGVDESTWVLTSYLVSNAIILPISGWCSTVMGRKNFYMLSVAIFTVSSLACGLAPSLGWLIFFRVVQGLGGGGLATSEQSMLADSFPAAKRGAAFALYGIAVVVAPAIGPTLGGWITDNFSWHWIFLINVPVGIASLTLTHFVLKEPALEKKERAALYKRGIQVDYVGIFLVAIGLAALQVMLDKGQREDWFESNFINAFFVIAVLCLGALVIWELTHPEPVVDLRLMLSPTFFSSCVMMFTLGFILFGVTQLIPQITQSYFGYTATLAGLALTPGGFAVMCMMPVVGFLTGKVQPKWLIAFGMSMEAYSMWYLSRLSLDAPFSSWMLGRIFQSMGMAFLFVPISTASYAGLPPEKSNNASALINLWRNIGGSFGVSLSQTWISRGQQIYQSNLVGQTGQTVPQYQHTVDLYSQAINHKPAAMQNAVEQSRSLSAMFQMLQEQAGMLAYINVFYILMWVALGAVLLVFLMKNVKPGEASHAG